MRFGMRRSNRNSTTTMAESWRSLAPSYFPGATPSLSKTHTFCCESWRTGLQSVLRSVLRSGLPKPLLYINQRIEDVLRATLFWRRQRPWVGRERPHTSRVAPGQLCSVTACTRAAIIHEGFDGAIAKLTIYPLSSEPKPTCGWVGDALGAEAIESWSVCWISEKCL